MSTPNDKMVRELNRQLEPKGYKVQPCKTLSHFFQVADTRLKRLAPCAPDPQTAVLVAAEEAKFNIS